jgi:hypothetical protein
VELIANTRTTTGLEIRAELHTNHDPTGRTASDQQLAAVYLHPAVFHGDWNYTIKPSQPEKL